MTVRPVVGTLAYWDQKVSGAPTSSAARVTIPMVEPAPVVFDATFDNPYWDTKSEGRWHADGTPVKAIQVLASSDDVVAAFTERTAWARFVVKGP